VREPDGLAMSSRNAYLTPEQRVQALVLNRALTRAADAIGNGERDPKAVAQLVREAVAAEPSVALEYVEVRDPRTIAPMTTIEGSVLVAVAAKVGTTRLIDNVLLEGTPCNAR
jgi:pantoate--beta-alanine ligase